MIIKELAAKAGINKRTIDTYVDSRAVIPNAEIAVRLDVYAKNASQAFNVEI